MGYKSRRASTGHRQLLGTLLVAWSLVTGCAAVFASAVYYRTGDLAILIAYLGAPFIIGTVLLFLVAISGWASRTKEEVIEPVSTEIRVRKDIHGLKRQRP